MSALAQPVVPLCTAKTVAAPKTWVIACADGNYWLSGLHWQGWGAATATATGTAHQNDCTPYCAAGHFHTTPVTVTVSRLRSCAGRREYARFVVHYGPGTSAVFKPQPFAEAISCKYP